MSFLQIGDTIWLDLSCNITMRWLGHILYATAYYFRISLVELFFIWISCLTFIRTKRSWESHPRQTYGHFTSKYHQSYLNFRIFSETLNIIKATSSLASSASIKSVHLVFAIDSLALSSIMSLYSVINSFTFGFLHHGKGSQTRFVDKEHEKLKAIGLQAPSIIRRIRWLPSRNKSRLGHRL